MASLSIVPKYDLAAERRKREEAEARAAKNWAALDALRPPNAHALIVAELEEDTSDPMSDYYGSRTARRVAIGWRTGKREDFKQLRRAAAAYAPTAHLGPNCGDFRVVAVWRGDQDYAHGRFPGCYMPTYDLHGSHYATHREAAAAIASATDGNDRYDNGRVEYVIEGLEKNIEHRDNYSMGHGNWVGCHRHSGWQVRSIDLEGGYRGDFIVLWLPGLRSSR